MCSGIFRLKESDIMKSFFIKILSLVLLVTLATSSFASDREERRKNFPGGQQMPNPDRLKTPNARDTGGDRTNPIKLCLGETGGMCTYIKLYMTIKKKNCQKQSRQNYGHLCL